MCNVIVSYAALLGRLKRFANIQEKTSVQLARTLQGTCADGEDL